MERELSEFRKKLERVIGNKETIELRLKNKKNELKSLQEELESSIEARIHLQEIAEKTMSTLEYKIEEVVTLALQTIIPDQEYEFKADIYIKNNKPHCELSFIKDGEKTNPLEDDGFGPANVAAFALRIVMWKISNPKTNNILILDEPFKDLSDDYIEAAFKFIKEISKELKIQIICVTHEKGLIEESDRIFNFKLKREKINGKMWSVSHVDVEDVG